MTPDVMAAFGVDPTAPSWDLPGVEPVPMARWGKDHWTTFAYVETRWVDYRGMIDHDRMRCDRARHPVFYGAKLRALAFGSNADGGKYATRLKTAQPRPDGTWGMVELPGHDDYDCLNDAIREGLIEVTMPREAHEGGCYLDAWDKGVRFGGDLIYAPVTGLLEQALMTAASFALTDRGQQVAGQLRAHLAATRLSHQFVPREPS